MMKPRGAVPAPEVPVQLTDAASGVFRHLGEASRQLMELQAQAAAIVLMDSAARYTRLLEEALRNSGLQLWTQVQRSQLRSVGEPLQAWTEAVLGLQAVVSAAWMQALALIVFPEPQATGPEPADDRRRNSVVIQFPDRRRSGAE